MTTWQGLRENTDLRSSRSNPAFFPGTEETSGSFIARKIPCRIAQLWTKSLAATRLLARRTMLDWWIETEKRQCFMDCVITSEAIVAGRYWTENPQKLYRRCYYESYWSNTGHKTRSELYFHRYRRKIRILSFAAWTWDEPTLHIMGSWTNAFTTVLNVGLSQKHLWTIWLKRCVNIRTQQIGSWKSPIQTHRKKNWSGKNYCRAQSTSKLIFDCVWRWTHRMTRTRLILVAESTDHESPPKKKRKDKEILSLSLPLGIGSARGAYNVSVHCFFHRRI